ncbi:MAG: AMP-binding protein [Myxococcota bacterium]|jgi:acyl-CoA synthetase (AMP-forming)/AMP-acid ligase II|nr:AMP-binding protein [Myxococcota bacterium]
MTISKIILEHCREQPSRVALVVPHMSNAAQVSHCETATYGELGTRIERFSAGLRRAGLAPGDRVVVMFKVSVDLYALVLGAMDAGLVVVFVDTGMGLRRVLQAIRESQARALVSVPAALRATLLAPDLWPLRRFAFSGRPEDKGNLRALSSPHILPSVPRGPTDHALVTFTSGSTGRPKGADRTHGLLLAQHRALEEEFPALPDAVDMPCFPVVALHNLACGITTVMPPVDLRKPATAHGELVASFASTHGVNRMSGAPAYLERLTSHLLSKGQPFSQLRELAVGGAPVKRQLCLDLRAAFPRARCKVVYGSTEAEPMASIDIDEIPKAHGEGHLVGYPAGAVQLRVVRSHGLEFELGPQGLGPFELGPGETGEVVAAGEHVNERYWNNGEETRHHKLQETSGRIWHRTFDTGHWDERGRLWITGRSSELVDVAGKQIQPYPLEAEINAAAGVGRCAFVSTKRGPTLFIEPIAKEDQNQIRHAMALWLEQRFGSVKVHIRFIQKLPMDPRHNSKVLRNKLQ